MTNLRYRGKVYHIQTEDSGVKNPVLFTHIFVGGSIIGTRKLSYADALERDDLEEHVRELMQKQHKEMEKALLAGEYDVANRAKAHANIPLARKRGASIGIHAQHRSSRPPTSGPRSFGPISQPAEPGPPEESDAPAEVSASPTPASEPAASVKKGELSTPRLTPSPKSPLQRGIGGGPGALPGVGRARPMPRLPSGARPAGRPLELSGLQRVRAESAPLPTPGSLLSPPSSLPKTPPPSEIDDEADMSLLGSSDMLFVMEGMLRDGEGGDDEEVGLHSEPGLSLEDEAAFEPVPFPTPYRTGHAIDPLLLNYFVEVSKPSFE